MRDNRPAVEPNIVYDDTPITAYMAMIHERLLAEGQVAFSSMFSAEMHKSAMIGVFLAMLELARHHGVETKQDELHGEIWLYPGRDFARQIDLSDADTYEHGGATPLESLESAAETPSGSPDNPVSSTLETSSAASTSPDTDASPEPKLPPHDG